VSERVREIPDLSEWAQSPLLHDRTPEHLYLDLLKKVLTRILFPEEVRLVRARSGLKRSLFAPARKLLAARGIQLARRFKIDREARENGRDWPANAETMVGLKRLDNLEFCVADVVRRGVPGDVIETGVWRGGASIFMRAVLKAYGDTERKVWAADSFEGLPKPDPSQIHDVADALWQYAELAIPLDQVKANFDRYGLLDDQVRFLPGWFQDTLPTAPIERLSVLRLDGDMYESTMVALEALYPKLSRGGYVIVDDYHAIQGCHHAVNEFRAREGIDAELHQVDWTCMFWRRER
jgi:O-methyltransferase